MSSRKPSSVITFLRVIFLVTCVSSIHAILRVNVGGPSFYSLGFHPDLTQYIANSNTVSVSVNPSTVSVPGLWKPVYSSYRYATHGNVDYRIPVPSGVFSVAVAFLESWNGASKPGVRVFDLKINGAVKKSSIDVAASVGFRKPLYLKFENIRPVNGRITITAVRIPGKQNPMLSAIIVNGPGAASKVGPIGAPPPSTSSSTSSNGPSSADPTCSTGIFGKNDNQMACCKRACGKCGGTGCGSFSPGEKCCITTVAKMGVSCDDAGPPCIPSTDLSPTGSSPSTPTSSGDPTCSTGVFGKNDVTGQMACCKSVCGQCGGAGCSTLVSGEACCISGVVAKNKSCNTSGPPCTPSIDLTGVGTSPPSTIAEPAPGVSCPVSGATSNSFRINTAGGPIASAAMGADNPDYVSSANKGLVFSSPGLGISSSKGPAAWDAAYTSHRWTRASVLAYRIPVPAGSYTVRLLFAETFFTAAGRRTFDIYINGVEVRKNFDVYKEVGKNVGLLVDFPGTSPQGGHITITLIKAVENPMISGIMIQGNKAGNLAVGGGCTTSNKKVETEDLNGGFNHRAHSVPGGPYMATDFDKNGRAFVSLDGTQSHSHYSDPGPPAIAGEIVSYKWTWNEVVDGKVVEKSNNDKSGKFTAAFPIGKTVVTLEVVDQTGDVAVDTVEVLVRGSTANGAYCYYYDYGSKSFSSVPLTFDINSEPKPKDGGEKESLNFKSASDFSFLKFKNNAFGVRCSFFVDIPEDADYSYTIQHEGPFKLYHKGVIMGQSNSRGTTSTKKKQLLAGLNVFQLVYFRPKNLSPKLVISGRNGPLSSPDIQHDSAATLPIIKGLSRESSAPAGGQNIQIYGSAFINGVSVKFGLVEASNLIASDPGVVQVTVPPGSGQVFVTVQTNAGTSNRVPFTYTSEETLEQPVIFRETSLQNPDGSTYEISFIAAATYGPDGRLYLGSTGNKVYALGISKDYKVTSTCEKTIGAKRAVLGVAFSPFSNKLKMYFTSNGLYWKDKNIFSFEQGWPNGKIETIEFSPTTLSGSSCAFNQQDLVTGLPVSNHDHGVNKLEFLPNGELLVGVGGFTNGGPSVPGKKPVPGDAPDDKLGGVASNPLSAAIVSCPANKKTNIVYDNYANPEKAKIVSGKACSVYASGLRNSFGMTLHTNGHLYAVDNGPNAGFGDFSTNCFGGTTPAKNIPDKLFKVKKGGYHGHPNLNRKECAHYPDSAVQPLIGNLKSSSNGIIEYRSNTFGGQVKGNIYVSKFSIQNAGVVSQVKLNGDGNLQNGGFAPDFLPYSGLSLVEGPRGELVMPRVYQKRITVGYASYPEPNVTFMLGVHPKQGPAGGGTKVLVSGHKFGPNPRATFGGKQCTNVKVISEEEFTCVTPSNSKNKKVSVIVTGSTGKSPSYGSDYWYF